MSLVIVDTGVANIASVVFAFERLGKEAHVSDCPDTIKNSERVILPGVGAAPLAMQTINSKGLTPVLKSLTQPVMGICLGMQLIFDKLDEGGGVTEGLGLVPGDVKRLNTKDLPSPHMGWNTLDITQNDPLLDGIKSGDYAYFVHSYAVKSDLYTLATSRYGTQFSAIVRNKNVYGCQFHPERSAIIGAKVLENFLKVST